MRNSQYNSVTDQASSAKGGGLISLEIGEHKSYTIVGILQEILLSDLFAIVGNIQLLNFLALFMALPDGNHIGRSRIIAADREFTWGTHARNLSIDYTHFKNLLVI